MGIEILSYILNMFEHQLIVWVSYLAEEPIFCQRCKPAKRESPTSAVPVTPRFPSSRGNKNSAEILPIQIHSHKSVNNFHMRDVIYR